MLKIKDNVDLKKIEKFGFIDVNNIETDFCEDVKYFCPAYDYDEYDCLTIFDDKSISVGLDTQNGKVLDTLYDLIKADLVEKVEE